MTTPVAAGVLVGNIDRFNGINVPAKSLPDNDHDFAKSLSASLEAWKAQGIRGVWITIPIAKGSFIGIAADFGFVFHHARGNDAVLTNWLPTEEINKLPPFPHTAIGVGGLVINDKRELLVVREKYQGAEAPWKLPGGLVDPKEELGDAACREVMEECGIRSEFVSVLGFRHFHQGLFATGDIYFIVRLKPLDEEIKWDRGELIDARWMPLDEYIDDPNVSDFNRWVGSLAREHLADPAATEFTTKALPTWNRRGTNLFYGMQKDVDAKL